MEITLDFIRQMVMYTTIAFTVFMVAMVIVWITFKGHRLSGESLAKIIERTEIPKLATIVLIIVAVTFLALLKIIEGEAVITILSGIAGYVLGGRASGKADRQKQTPTAQSS
ncbi:hypothetical protein GUA87_15555 [Sneathiella sp. P13V-1]|uniref:hypothetical protein n=1 Tax=Sneathiella sp. P13V-1 TaxID=2697366 RepID=UPI00187B470F|nr:hypothetical protein [Sneathiella sp. P13V-1]MBE7638273.1 hypothetical protein [Sneathiella sp. P13V-1]